MEFGVYNDYVPDYGILVNLRPFFLVNLAFLMEEIFNFH